ncbi:ABC transporter permease [Aliirhizobium cellulosilyticum]|uniref:Peptide/nickel transport system permease protein n=1 Tax=Aliirhizobium cellulosilyticum TaxID=393664 RepID=A0A7W6WQH0_9HYPH|nr:ABC transporter permease [Rhizobium cellulosilyticum]MBB4349397.1 peptide/nickel transport system permease protein [Rhizobium cellulosilyticum]MBB4412381.1 peptide/nickel transport system permease protein [Rhizobium cellulosilyticum]MBB4447013.1 peptide/nickel transport system permease protein [Rhizobium cellulosilyticum]
MFNYAIRRIVTTIPVLFGISILVFLTLRVSSGDPAAILGGDAVTPEQIAAIRQQLGLGEPLWKQYLAWLSGALRGDFGVSYYYKMPVTQLILSRVEPTIVLAFLTLAISVMIAIPLGTAAAYRAGSVADNLSTAVAVMGFSVPVFVVGYALIGLFSIKLGLTPVQGYQRLSNGISGTLSSTVLPAIALSTVYIGLLTRITRASVLEVLNADYVRTAKAKGLLPFPITTKHVLRNAAAPIVTVIAMGLASLISGVVVTESVFNIPGLGRLMVDAVLARDYPTVQAIILIFTVFYIVINLLADISYGILDPRVNT